MQEDQNYKGFLQKTHCNPSTSAEKFGDLITADHKVPSEECESRNKHRYAVLVQDLAAQWLQSYPCKTKSSQETEKSLRKFLESRQTSRKSFTLTIPWSLAKPVESSPGIIATSTPHRSESNVISKERNAESRTKPTVLLRELYAELKKGRLQYYCNPTWMKSGRLIQWNVAVICETFKTSYRTGKLSTNGDLENHSVGRNSFRIDD